MLTINASDIQSTYENKLDLAECSSPLRASDMSYGDNRPPSNTGDVDIVLAKTCEFTCTMNKPTDCNM